jgi:hypothetical protein
MISDSTTMADLADRGEFPDPADTRFVLEINTDLREAVIEFRESLTFHRGYNGAAWSRLCDSNGYLTASAAARLAEQYSTILAHSGISGVTVTYASGMEFDDEPSVALSFVSVFSPGETFDSWFARIGRPIIAEVINSTDPGTYNSAYVYTALLAS